MLNYFQSKYQVLTCLNSCKFANPMHSSWFLVSTWYNMKTENKSIISWSSATLTFMVHHVLTTQGFLGQLVLLLWFWKQKKEKNLVLIFQILLLLSLYIIKQFFICLAFSIINEYMNKFLAPSVFFHVPALEKNDNIQT